MFYTIKQLILYVQFVFVVSRVQLNQPNHVISKCCPAGEQLGLDLNSCVGYKKYNRYSLENSYEVPVPDNKSLPWWIHSDVRILSHLNMQPTTSSFLRGKFVSYFVNYGQKQPCTYRQTKPIFEASEYSILDNGTLIYYDILDGEERSISFKSSDYCIDRIDPEDFQMDRDETPSINNADDVQLSSITPQHVVMLCPCRKSFCLTKCCAKHQLLSIQNDLSPVCVSNNSSDEWIPDLYSYSEKAGKVKVGGPIPGSRERIILLNSFPICGGKTFELLNNHVNLNKTFKVLSDGKVQVENLVVSSDYCVDVSEYGNTRTQNMIYCSLEESEEFQSRSNLLYGALFIIGSVFLFLTLVVYSVLPGLRSLHGNNLMGHTASLLVGYVVNAVGQLYHMKPLYVCVSIGFIVQFSFLAAFFWLNVMCIDISWAFSGLRAPQGSALERDRKKYVYYSIYAWGSTFLISLITAIVEFSPAIPDSILKPNFGQQFCWFKDKLSTLVFFYLPMALLLLANLLLFIYTATRIIKLKQETAILHSKGSGRHTGSSSNYKKDKQRLILYGKLFSLMGLTWVTEILSWAIGGPNYYWYITDIVNLLRAVFIFIIFCCKRTVWNMLNNRLEDLGIPVFNRCLGSQRSNDTTSTSPGTRESSSRSHHNTSMTYANGSKKTLNSSLRSKKSSVTSQGENVPMKDLPKQEGNEEIRKNNITQDLV